VGNKVSKLRYIAELRAFYGTLVLMTVHNKYCTVSILRRKGGWPLEGGKG
jgi:hypothetical protein